MASTRHLHVGLFPCLSLTCIKEGRSHWFNLIALIAKRLLNYVIFHSRFVLSGISSTHLSQGDFYQHFSGVRILPAELTILARKMNRFYVCVCAHMSMSMCVYVCVNV